LVFGLYVHIPFCAKRCDYCAFATWTDRHHLHDRYLAALRGDAQRWLGNISDLTSIFVGGGTPSIVDPVVLCEVLDVLPRVDGCEVSIECNPDDVTDELIGAYADGGVGRISLGVQSLDPSVLAILGRSHDPAAVQRAVGYVRRHGLDCNLDVIYGSVGETVESWRSTIEGVAALEPDHVSAYGLTVEAGTPLALTPERYPDDDDQATKYEIADTVLTAAGFGNYEISNWSQAGHECRHNQLYWSQGDYVGLGCAAHSHRDGRRWWNLRTPERYCDAVERGESVEAADELLDAETRRVERLQLQLRMREGVPRDALDGEELGDLVVLRDDRWVLSQRGRLLANQVALRLK
jgi:putative oxygen-independent coproporphyrinogen III oxidase